MRNEKDTIGMTQAASGPGRRFGIRFKDDIAVLLLLLRHPGVQSARQRSILVATCRAVAMYRVELISIET